MTSACAGDQKAFTMVVDLTSLLHMPETHVPYFSKEQTRQQQEEEVKERGLTVIRMMTIIFLYLNCGQW